MLTTTEKAIAAIAAADPSIDRARLREGLRVIAGEISAAVPGCADDRAISRAEAAQILGCSLTMISQYARRGLIRPVRLGATGARAMGYSKQSVMALLAG